MLQTFVAAKFLTNTVHFNAVQGLQEIMAFWHEMMCGQSPELFLHELSKAKDLGKILYLHA
jgi:hypothetical protein